MKIRIVLPDLLVCITLGISADLAPLKAEEFGVHAPSLVRVTSESSAESPSLGKGQGTFGAVVAQMEADLELIRLEIGKPERPALLIKFEGASQCELYSISYSLLDKLNQLYYEQFREQRLMEAQAECALAKESDVREMLIKISETVALIKRRFGIEEDSNISAGENVPDEPNALLFSLFQANQTAARLLEDPITPSDVYQRVHMALQLALKFRAKYPGNRIPDTPAFERRKTPSQVSQNLIGCLELVADLAKRFGERALSVHIETDQEQRMRDVFEFANLMVTQLKRLASSQGVVVGDGELATYDPGVKLPSHVYQRVNLLKRVLKDVLQLSQVDSKGVGAAG